MQSMPSIASCMDLDFKRLQLQCGSQSKPLGSLRWNSQVEGMKRGRSRNLDFKPLQLQYGSQSKPLGSLMWNSRVEGIKTGRSRGMWGMHSLPPAIFHNALDK